MVSRASSLRILVVDDDEISRVVLEEHLSGGGNEVSLASDVAGAMRLLEAQKPQIVIADWIMPGASGVELCQWIRRQPWGEQVYFVMLTVLSEKAKLIEAFEAGVDDFLTKPLHEGELMARLNAWNRITSLQAQLAQRHAEAIQANRDLAEANATLADLAIRDELTGLANRREAIRRLQEQWAISVRYEQPLACAIVDVDCFKEINDHFGHRAGDKVLKDLAARLSACVRQADGLFRIGGDEFLLLFPCAGIGVAHAWAKRCGDHVSAEPFAVMNELKHIGITIGAAERESQTTDWQEMVDTADRAMLASKRRSRAGATN
jgi:two-component system cell cycle response regulator